MSQIFDRWDYVVDAIETELRSEGPRAETFTRLDPANVRIGKTASRRTLRFINEMAFELEWHIAHDGGLDRTDINDLNHALRSHGRDYAQPIELVNQHLTIRIRTAVPPDTSPAHQPTPRQPTPASARVSEPYGLDSTLAPRAHTGPRHHHL